MGKKDIDASEAANLRNKQLISNQFSHLATVANLRTNCHVCGITSKVYPQKFKDFDVNFEIHKQIGKKLDFVNAQKFLQIKSLVLRLMIH